MKTLKMLGAALAAVTMTFTAQAAKTAKAVVADGGKTLRFVYDGTYYGTKGTDWFSVAEAEMIDPDNDEYVPWYGKRSTVTKVVFDSSFAAYRPKQCGSWFYDFGVLAAVDGLTNLDTSGASNMAQMFCSCRALESLDVSSFNTANVTDMSSMFLGCESLTSLNLASFDTAKVVNMVAMFEDCTLLTTLDVSGFDTANVTDMRYMFFGCSSLEAICASDRFVTDKVLGSSGMFENCSKLKGGAGTEYNSSKTDKTYAHIDGKDGQPGYFTSAADVYKIRFAANGGAGTMADQICVKGKIYNIRKCAFTAPSGKTFAGWKSSKNGKLYADGILVFDLAEPGETVTMTAVWK